MSVFGMEAEAIETLIGDVTPRKVSPAEAADQFARATWSSSTEPGDRVAGILIQSLGADAALTAVMDKLSSSQILDLVAESASVDLDSNDIDDALKRWYPRLSTNLTVIALKQAARIGVTLITPAGPEWPSGFNDLGVHAPHVLWVRGNLSTLMTLDQSISLTGARAATGYGEHVAMESAAGLVERGYTLVSGAAFGIDGMVHRAALASSGNTVAVLAGGVDRFHPSGHDALLTRIIESGAVVSELPPGSQPTKWRFLQRNRLVAAMTQATVVVEAGWRSGALNTAGHAVAIGRPLGAVPGPVTSATSAGCHRLIREFDAACVTNTAEMAELAPIHTDAR